MNVDQIDLFTPGYANLCFRTAQPTGAIRRVHYSPADLNEPVVEETLLLDLAGTPAEIEAAQSALQTRLELAREQFQRTGLPTCLQVSPQAGLPAWNSPLVDVWLEGAGGDRLRGSVGLKLHVRRLNYWEAVTESALPLSNRNAAATTSGLTVWNHCDAAPGHDNWVAALAADIAGDLPAPLKLEVFDLSNISPGNKDLIVTQSIYANPVSAATVLECGGSASTACSNGDYTSVAVSAEAKLIEKDLPAALAHASQGGYFLALLKLKDSLEEADVWLKTRLIDGDGQVHQESPYGLVPSGENVIELGTLQIPPRLIQADQTASVLKIELWGKKTSGSVILNMDYVLLAPLDGYRRYTVLSNTDWQNAALVDDGFRGLVYRQDASGSILPVFVASGEPLRLMPGRDACFTFQLAGAGISEIERQMRVRLWTKARKRRL